jgi:glycosyltransferase involved in cell wall biosynthesis
VKIAQIAPLYESVPPKLYGGTERVVSYLTEELVTKGHEVTLFASGDSVTTAQLIPACNQSLRLDASCQDQLAHHIKLLNLVADHAADFDILHFHIDYLHFPLSTRQKIPHVTTLHGRLDLPDLVPVYRDFNRVPLVSISDSQREPLPFVRWVRTIHHGLPEQLYSYGEGRGGYLAFLGRISREKRVDRAIEIAKRSGRKLKIAAKIDKADRDYFESDIKHLLDDPLVEYVGEVGERDKNEFLRNAEALLFPIDWPEPFGLVMIEAMACGTPVIAYRRGSVSEIIDDGVTGYMVQSIDEAVTAVQKAESLSRPRCRAMFEKRFSAARMARDYVSVYRQLIEEAVDKHEIAATLEAR